MRSPLKWLGGKGVLMPKLLPYLEAPDHDRYCSVFGGGASDLFAKRPVPHEVYNDLDQDLAGFFRVLQGPEYRELVRRLYCTPYSRGERNSALAADPQPGTIEGARLLYCRVRQGFAGLVDKTAWGFVKGSSASTTRRWWSSIACLDSAHRRLQNVEILNVDWSAVLRRHDSPTTLFYLDPPYCQETRRDGFYRHEMQQDQHRDLVKSIQTLKGHVVLSGYCNEIYQELETAGWERHDFAVACMVVARTEATGLIGTGAVTKQQGRTESIWIKP